MLVLIKGAGDLATGVAHRLYRAGFDIVMTETHCPTTVRRTVAFSPAVYLGETEVEGVCARRAESPAEALALVKQGFVAVLEDEEAACLAPLSPPVVVDAILAKKNLGTTLSDAPIVVALGPGFTAGEDCHAVVETKRGHYLGRVLLKGSAIPNTGIPGSIGGYTTQRLVRATGGGLFTPLADIGEEVKAGQIIAKCGDLPVAASIDGVLRGILQPGTPVYEGMKCGDIDPRCEKDHCFTISDKARSVGGGVLEAILLLNKALCKKEAGL